MIKKELHFVWITKNGKKFLDKNEAEKYEKLNFEDDTNNKIEEKNLWRQTKAKQRAIDLNVKL